MSTHIEAKDGEIAPQVLLPGDPLRAKFIAETFLENAVCYNKVRGMFGYTGTYKGRKISVQGTGMGQPSISIYAEELFRFYGVKDAVRVGTCGGIGEGVKLRDVILAEGACTDSGMQAERFGNKRFAPVADYTLLCAADKAAKSLNIKARVGLCASGDMFYDKGESWRLWAKYGVLGVEMEAAELYTLAAEYGRRALAVFTVSNVMGEKEETTAEERERTFSDMIKVALEALVVSFDD